MQITSFVFLVIAVAVGGLVWWVSQPVFDETIPADALRDLAVAPITAALTLARTHDGRTLLITGSSGSTIEGVVLASDPGMDGIDIYHQLGATGMMRALEQPAVQVDLADLGVPFREPSAGWRTTPHIAAGTNFRAHAQEVGAPGEPFLFPKLSAPTPWNATVNAAARLDYEVELCAITLEPYDGTGPTTLGFLLCGDFTDRWALVTEMDSDTPMGVTGFASAKGGASHLPVGPFLVIPAEPDAFYQNTQLALYLNGQLRQRASAADMIWSPAEILRRALADCEKTYLRGQREISLAPCAGVPAKSMVLTGTPAGVIFKPLNVLVPGYYLKPGDEVVSTASNLGAMHNAVVNTR